MPFNILRTESKSDYAKLRADFVEGLNPTDVIERRFVDDIVHHTWEMMRYQRVATGIHNSAFRRALAQMLNEILLPPSTVWTIECWMSSQRLSYGWLLDPQGKRQVASLLREAGLDESAIEAKAYMLEADNIEKANRMFRSAQEGRDKALRSIAKYRKSLAIQLRRNSDRVLVADRAALIAGGEEN